MLISPTELSIYAKKCTTGEQEATRGIREAEWFDVIPTIGAALYKAIESKPTDYNELLEGGVTYTDSGCSGGTAMLQGLKTAIAYFAEARIAQNNNVQLDRYGATIKQNEYGTQAESARYKEESTYLHTCGDKAMQSVVGYIKSKETSSLYAPYLQKPHDEERTNFEDINFINPD